MIGQTIRRAHLGEVGRPFEDADAPFVTTWLYRETDVFDSVTTGPWQPHFPVTPFCAPTGCG
jgi:hypothetical protein